MENKKQLPKFLADSFEVLLESLPENERAKVAKLLEQGDEKSFARVSEILDQIFPEIAGEGLAPEDEHNISIETALSFLDAGDIYSAREFASRALTADPSCVESMFVMAETASGPYERVYFATQILDLEARRLGPDVMGRPDYPFWADIETRNYLRALHMRGVSLCDALDFKTAIEDLEESIRRDPSDNLEVRSMLLAAYIATKNIAAADELFATYPDYVSCSWLFGRALRTFVGSDDIGRAEEEIKAAHAYNPHVVPLLISGDREPEMSDTCARGSREEARHYIDETGSVWDGIEGALSWLGTVNLPVTKKPTTKRKR